MKKIPIWKNIILIISVLVIIMVATFAWFYTGPSGQVSDVDVSVGKATYVQVSGDGGNQWQEDMDVELEIGINKNFKEISGNGTIFFVPSYNVPQEAAPGEYCTQLEEFVRLDGKEYYYEEVLDFRANTVQEVYLSPESLVTAEDGSFIDGAIRIAFLEVENGREVLKFIWAPNSNVRYVNGEFTRDGEVESAYYYQKTTTFEDPRALNPSDFNGRNVAVISTVGKTSEGCGYDSEQRFLWSHSEWQELPAGVPAVLKENDSGSDQNLFYKKLIVRVWLEGHDSDCVSLLSGQKFTMKLHFIAQEVE